MLHLMISALKDEGVFTLGDAWSFSSADVKNSTIGFNAKF